jgi:hypothetical protein
MTKLLEEALEAVRRLPPDGQDSIARAMLTLAGGNSAPDTIDPAHLADVLDGLAEAERGEFASDDEVQVAFGRLGG